MQDSRPLTQAITKSFSLYSRSRSGALKTLVVTLFASSFFACGADPQLEQKNTAQVTHSKSALKNKIESSTPASEFQSPYTASEVLKYPQYTLLTKYSEEQTIGVKYYSSKERESLKVSVKEGLLFNAKGRPLDAELDQPENSSRTGKAIYVISVDGGLWVTFDQRYGLIHHSSLLAAAPVLAAGELVLDKGQLLSISNSSGHYKPAPESLDVALEILKRLKVDLSQTERVEIGPTGLPLRKPNP